MNKVLRLLTSVVTLLLTFSVTDMSAQSTTRRGTNLRDNGAVQSDGNTTTINLNQVFKNAKDRREEREQRIEKTRDSKKSQENKSSQEEKGSSISRFNDSAPKAADDIKLVVDGEGPNKTEATKVALRSAIEQAYGTFVSANTDILNDELVKDEIVTVSSGNIKSYKELSSTVLPNGNTYVSLSAVVSIGKLISYAQSKGASAEFAGQTFMMNMKMRELNKKNEAILEHIINQFYAVCGSFYDYSLVLGDPKEVEFKNIVSRKGYRYYYKTSDEIPTADCEGLKYQTVSGYCLPMTIVVKLNDNYTKWNECLVRTLSELQLSQKERDEYRQSNSKIDVLVLPDLESYSIRQGQKRQSFYLRNDTQGFKEKVLKGLRYYHSAKLTERHSDGDDVQYICENGVFFTNGLRRLPYEFQQPWEAPSERWPISEVGLCPYVNTDHNELSWEWKINWYMEKDALFSLSGFDVSSWKR